jgi:prolyl-tRNA synthetase
MWNNLFEMIEDMQKHVLAGDVVVSSDDPMRRVIGFTGPFEVWEIALTTVMESPRFSNGSSKHRRITKLIRTIPGRAQLCQRGAILSAALD